MTTIPPTRELLSELPGGFLVARAVESDIASILALLVDDGIGKSREADPADPRYHKAFVDIAGDPGQTLAVVIDPDGVVCGTLQLTATPGLSRMGATRVTVEAVRIDGARRGSGLGSAVMGWAIEYSRGLGASLMQLTTDQRRVDAHRFYSRLGFASSHLGMKLDLTMAAAPTPSVN